MQPSESAPTTVHVRMNQELLALVDGEVDRLKALAPGAKASRASVIRHLVSTLPAAPTPDSSGKKSKKPGRRRTP